MAIVYPDINTIKKMKPQPTEGELYLVETLQRELPDAFNVYFQPFIEGDKPDVILMSRETGITIIEVKDWDLRSYRYKKSAKENEYGEFILSYNNQIVGNPIRQVENYKHRIFNLYIPEVFIENEKDRNLFGKLVKTAVYFHKRNYTSGDRIHSKYSRILFGKDELFKFIDDEIIYYKRIENRKIRNYIYENSVYNYMNMNIGRNRETDLYTLFHTMFLPAYHRVEDGKEDEIKFNDKQYALIESVPGDKKIRGVAGSGKTLVLARRAVSAFKRTNEQVLVLTYNITMKNYIKDRISEVRENFPWSKFYISNYHLFITKSFHNMGLEFPYFNKSEGIDDDEFDKELRLKLEEIKDKSKIKKYKTILIDEGQDFRKEWFGILKDFFLEEGGEFVIFADEKQNMYSREVDKDKKIVTNIPGRWTELNISYRMDGKISHLASDYQKYFMADKYEVDEDLYNEEKEKQEQMEFNAVVDKRDIKYIFNNNISYKDIFNEIMEYSKEKTIHRNNIAVISSKVEVLRNFMNEREKSDYKAIRFARMSENKEEYEEIEKAIERDIIKKIKENKLKNNTKEEKEEVEETRKKLIENKLRTFRKIKKNVFFMDRGMMKVSTIHSFKGWEIETVALIIEDGDSNNLEAIYTGITRSKNNLLIFNRGDKKLDEFFRVNIKESI